MTVDVLERPKRSLVEKLFYGTNPKNLNQVRVRPILFSGKMYVDDSIVSRNIDLGLVQIFAGVDRSLDRGAE